jgi:hypothetical protein
MPGSDNVTVAVVGICGPEHLERCLGALDEQRGAPPFETLVVYDPHLIGMEAVRGARSAVRFVANQGQRTPLELAARAVAEADGDLILLTEDHCVPGPDWVKELCSSQAAGRAAVGGLVHAAPGMSAVDWAFYYVDFFRYSPPAEESRAPSLTVCNVAYRRDHLAAVRGLWGEIFHETAINDALRQRFGALWLHPSAEVTMRRHVRLADAVKERYAFGRLFGCTRLEFVGPARRLAYALLAPMLPVLLLGRMARKAFQSRTSSRRFMRSLPALILLVVAWSWGEWLGYLTARRPASELVAPEIMGSAQR